MQNSSLFWLVIPILSIAFIQLLNQILSEQIEYWIFYFPFQIPACWQLAAHIGAQQRGPRRQLREGQDQEVAPKDGQVPQ